MPAYTAPTPFLEDESPDPWRCVRCRHEGNLSDKCGHCGVGRNRIVRRRPTGKRKAGGKRGRNSGTVGTAKNK